MDLRKIQDITNTPTKTTLKMRLFTLDRPKAMENAPTSMSTILPGPIKVDTSRMA